MLVASIIALSAISVTSLSGTSLAGPLLEVEGTALCPRPADVADRVDEILGNASNGTLRERAFVDEDGATVRVRLMLPEGRLVGERRFPVGDDCSALARAAAVVLATWISDAHPEYVRSLPASPSPLLPLPGPVAGGPDRPSSVVPRERERRAPRDAHERSGVIRRFSASAGLGVGLAGSEPAPLASFSVTWAPRESGLGFTLIASPQASRELPLGPGRVVWMRWPLALAPVWRFAGASSTLDAAAGAAIGWLRIEGQGFTPNQATSDVTWGALTRVQVSGSGGKLEPFLAAQALYWLKGAEAFARPSVGSVSLPPLDLSLIVGLTVAP